MNRRVQVLGALALALAIAAWWGRPQPVDRRAELDWGLPALAEVTDITLTRTGQPEVRLVHGEAGWQVMPAGAPADEYAVADLQAALATPVGVDQAQPRATAALDDFGLGEHALHVRLGRRVDKPLAFRVGKLVDGRRTFVLPDEGDHLYRARVDLRRAFDRPAAEWRERRLFAHAYGEVAALQATRGEQLEWRARRVDAQTPWRFEVPADRVAGQQELDGVANSLATARAVAFEDDPAAPFSPRLRVQAETFDGAFFGLDLEAPAPDGSARVRRVAGGPIARLPRHLVLFLDVKPNDLRERRLIGCAPEKVEAVVIAGEV
ncbi:MAG: DUF4340 domain-containing protein, partial [Myxococcales bacterium]|nr:DUF4340 domain-containing protein [Myxococcales bacterium]